MVDEIYDAASGARSSGLDEVGQVTVMIHPARAGFGHQVCDDYLEVMERAAQQATASSCPTGSSPARR